MIQSVDRAIRILGVLQGARRLSLSEISARIELPPSTVHGILRTLLAHGMVVQDRDYSRYQLGPAVLKLGNVYLDTLELRSRALVWSASAADPGQYFLLDRGTNQMHPVVDPYPDIDPAQLAPVQPIRYQARDGLTQQFATDPGDLFDRHGGEDRQLRAEREEEAADRVRGRHRERGHDERLSYLSGNVRTLRGEPQRHAVLDRLRHQQHADERSREHREHDDVGDDPRGRQELHRRRGDQRAQCEAGRADGARQPARTAARPARGSATSRMQKHASANADARATIAVSAARRGSAFAGFT